MGNASASGRAAFALGVALGLVTLAAAPAHALLTQDGRIVWNFDAEGGIHGTLDWAQDLPGQEPRLTLSGPAGTLTSLSGQAGILAGDINDELISQFFFDNASLGALLGVPGATLGGQALLSLGLTDTDAIAFHGAPPLPGSSDPIYRQAPVSPPPLALFEDAGIFAEIGAVCLGCGSNTGSPIQVSVSRNLTALPEPPPAALLVCALAAAMGLRRERVPEA